MTGKEHTAWRKAHKKEWEEAKERLIKEQDGLCPFCALTMLTKKGKRMKNLQLHHLDGAGSEYDLSFERCAVLHGVCHNRVHRERLLDINKVDQKITALEVYKRLLKGEK